MIISNLKTVVWSTITSKNNRIYFCKYYDIEYKYTHNKMCSFNLQNLDDFFNRIFLSKQLL